MWRATVVVLAGVAAFRPAAVHAQPDVTARGAIIVDADTGAVIWEQNADDPLPPASTTKVMTAVLALQSHRLDQEFMVSSNAAATPPSKIGLRPGQSVALRDLLYAVLLKSANDASVVVAEGVSGSEIGFADQMNLKARVVGATTTNFVNPHGLTEYGHVTTARDLSRIFRYGLGVPGFREVLGTTAAEVFIDGPAARLATVRSHNRLLNAPDYQVIGKTGYTRLARRCFVGAAGHGPREVVIAILGSSDLWGDARRMLYYGLRPDRPTPALMASATPPPPAELGAAPSVAAGQPQPAPELRAAPPPAEPERPVGVAGADSTVAPRAAVQRAARMARARGVESETVHTDEELIEADQPDDEQRTGAPRRLATPPAPIDHEPERRPAREDAAHPELDRDAAPEGAVERPLDRAPTAVEERVLPAAAEERDPSGVLESRPAAVEPRAQPAAVNERQPAPAAPDEREQFGRGAPDEPGEPGTPDDREPDRAPGPSLWADSPLRQPGETARPAAARRPRGAEEVTPARAPQNEPAPALAPARPRRPTPDRGVERERSVPAAVARAVPEQPRKAVPEQPRKMAREDAQPAASRRHGDVVVRVGADDRRKPLAHAVPREPSAEPARVATRDARRQPERAQDASADRHRMVTARSDRDDRRQPVALARAAVLEPRPSRLTARGLEAERGRTPKTARAGKRGAEAEAADQARAAGKYTVQLGPYRGRKAVATARADLAKRGYEARVVGQKLERGNFAERKRADRLATRLRVNGHRATSAAAR